MKLQGLSFCFFVFMVINGFCSTAQADLFEVSKFPSLNAPEADWIFSGSVINENGERYNYFFQMNRVGTTFRSIATLINSQTKKILIFDKNTAQIQDPSGNNWHVGHAFLQFNPINDSWIFGVKDKEKGFNFKVDMMKNVNVTPSVQDLRKEIVLHISQTAHLNGHLTTADGQEEFVTADKAWFRQIWSTKSQPTNHSFTGILCQFNDGSGLYALHSKEADAIRGAIAGYRDTKGMPVAISQFVSVKEQGQGKWDIQVSSPKIKIEFENAMTESNETNSIVAGIIQSINPGFCVISNDEIGTKMTIEKNSAVV